MVILPLHIICYAFESPASGKREYRIDDSKIEAHPYQLFRLEGNEWENLSVYASVSDAVRVLLKELVKPELADEINHGQAIVNPREILDKISQGERTVSIGAPRAASTGIKVDVSFEALIERKVIG